MTLEKIDTHTSPPLPHLGFSKHHKIFRASSPSTAQPYTYFSGLKRQMQHPLLLFCAEQASMARLNLRYPYKLLTRRAKQSTSLPPKKLYLSSSKVVAGSSQLAVRTANCSKRASKDDLAIWLSGKQYAWVCSFRLVGSGARLSLLRRYRRRTRIAKG